MKFVSFDLETTNLNGNFGVILCACVKPYGEKVKIFRGDNYSSWTHKRSDDSKLARDVYEELKQHRVWIAHNGIKFDVPFLRTRLMKAGTEMSQPIIYDPVRLARRYMKFGYNSLEQVGAHFGIGGKTLVTGDHWMKAALDGNHKSMNYIVEHCVADVEILERVAEKFAHLIPKLDTRGSDQ